MDELRQSLLASLAHDDEDARDDAEAAQHARIPPELYHHLPPHERDIDLDAEDDDEPGAKA